LPGSSSTRSASIGTPFFCAKPIAALVGLPAASNAARAGGPTTRSLTSRWRSATAVAISVRRRGVPIARAIGGGATARS
jgi:hypothetical protein